MPVRPTGPARPVRSSRRLRRLRRVRGVAALAVAGSLALSACSTRDSGGSDGAAGGDVKTDVGVTADTIKLGVLSDFSVVYGPLAKTVYAGDQIWAREVNEAGGICGRKVEFEVQDQKMDTQLANTQYAGMKDKVLGLVHVLGSPVISALLPQIKADRMPTIAVGWSSAYLGTPQLAVLGTTYALDEINGVQHLVDAGKVAKGDAIGHLYMAGDFGENAAEGGKFAAERLGLRWVGKKVDPTATDISAEMAALQAAGVKAILVSTGPKQTAMVASQAPALGLDVPLLVNAPSYDPSLLASPAGPTILKNLEVVTSLEPYAGDSDVQKSIAAAFPKVAEKGVNPTQHVLTGYAGASVLGQALEAACKAGDLTRASVDEQLRKLSSVESGVYPTLDLTDPAAPSSDQSLVLKAAKNDGGLELEKDYFVSPLVADYLKG